MHKPAGHHGIETISSHSQNCLWGLGGILQLHQVVYQIRLVLLVEASFQTSANLIMGPCRHFEPVPNVENSRRGAESDLHQPGGGTNEPKK